MVFGHRVTTTTQDRIVPKVVDGVLNSNVFATKMLSKAKKWRGENMKFPLFYQTGTAGQAFDGFDVLPTTASDTRVNMQFAPKAYAKNVALALTELTANSGDEQVLDLISLEMQRATQEMADEVGTLFYSTGAGKNFKGLEDIVDDGTNNSTYAGLTRATYATALNSTVTASSGTITLAKVDTLWDAISSGSVQPTAAYCRENIFSWVGQLLESQKRIVVEQSAGKKGVEGMFGFTSLYYRGKPIYADEKATSGVFYLLNEDFIEWYAKPMAMSQPVKFKSQDIEGNDYSEVTGLGFSWSDFVKSQNSATVNGFVYLFGELVGSNGKRQGKLTGITGI